MKRQKSVWRFGRTAGDTAKGRYSPQLEFFQGQIFAQKVAPSGASVARAGRLKSSQRGAAGFGAEPQYYVGGICHKRTLQCDDHFDLSHRFFGSPSERACQIRFRLSADNVRDIGTLYANKAVFDANVPVFGTLSTLRGKSCA